jgi:hemoglobin
MKTAHAGMGITSMEFDALVGDLVATLNKFKVPEREKNELLGALGPMKKDIVEKPFAGMPLTAATDRWSDVNRFQEERASVSF